MANGDLSQGLLNLTLISSKCKVALVRNIHTRAPPPWFDATKGDQLNLAQKSHIPSKTCKSKLNPKRVGAAWAERRKLELELEKRGEPVDNNFDSNWLLNFGRVWQFGTRKESRKEFQKENKANEPEMLMPLQPYISKRMVAII